MLPHGRPLPLSATAARSQTRFFEQLVAVLARHEALDSDAEALLCAGRLLKDSVADKASGRCGAPLRYMRHLISLSRDVASEREGRE